MCIHKNITIKSSSHYIIPEGWEWLQEQENIDMTDWFVRQDDDVVVCQDCGEELN